MSTIIELKKVKVDLNNLIISWYDDDKKHGFVEDYDYNPFLEIDVEDEEGELVVYVVSAVENSIVQLEDEGELLDLIEEELGECKFKYSKVEFLN